MNKINKKLKGALKTIWRKVTRYYARLHKKEMALEKIRKESDIKLHLGCGNEYKQGYINVDAYSETADVKADITSLAPFEDNSIDLIETHHVLEHLSCHDSETTLSICANKLKQGGNLIISVPDLNECCRLWLDSPNSERWKYGGVVHMIYGSQEHDGMFHKSGYTPYYLSNMLNKNGFKVKFILHEYPQRPTPSFLILATKAIG